MKNNVFTLNIVHLIVLFATPKKRTSKAKSRSRYSHWLSKPEEMLKKIVSSGKKNRIVAKEEKKKKTANNKEDIIFEKSDKENNVSE